MPSGQVELCPGRARNCAANICAAAECELVSGFCVRRFGRIPIRHRGRGARGARVGLLARQQHHRASASVPRGYQRPSHQAATSALRIYEYSHCGVPDCQLEVRRRRWAPRTTAAATRRGAGVRLTRRRLVQRILLWSRHGWHCAWKLRPGCTSDSIAGGGDTVHTRVSVMHSGFS